MAFNGSGLFVRIYNWVIDRDTGIKIRADRMDAEMDGFATGLSTCITKDAQTATTARIPFALGVGLGDGTVGAPAINFTADTDTGIYRIGANEVGIAVNGAKVVDVTTAGIAVTGVTGTGNGTASLPSYSFSSDLDTGIYHIAANEIGVAANGALVVDVATTGVTITPAAGNASVALTTTSTGSGSFTGSDAFGYFYNIHNITSGLDTSGSTGLTAFGRMVKVSPDNSSKSNIIAGADTVTIASTATIDTTNGGLTDFVGHMGYSKSSKSLGGTNLVGGERGGLFGHYSVVINNTTNLVGVVGHEINVQTFTGSTQVRRFGVTSLAFAPSESAGSTYDAAYHVGASGGITAPWKTGVLFSIANGGNPMDVTNGKLIATQGSATTNYGVDISSYTFTTAAFQSNGFVVNGSGALTANGGIGTSGGLNVSAGGASIAGGLTVSSGTSAFGAVTEGVTTITTNALHALAVGPNGATNPTFNVDSGAASATGWTVVGAAAGSGTSISVSSPNTNELGAVNAKGSADLYLQNTATGAVRVGAGGLLPITDDASALGNTTNRWADLHLSTGAVINYNNGNLTITQSSQLLTSTGDLTISKATPAFTLNKAASGQHNLITGQKGGLLRWNLSLGDDTAEGGSNVGSDVKYFRYDDAGGFLAAAVTITRSTGGVLIGSPTGGDKGTGTLNAVAVYDDNVLLTCYVLQAFMEGKIDTAEWDRRVVNRIIPAHEEETTDPHDATKKVKVVKEPQRIEVRNHEPARAFAKRMDELDPGAFAEKWKATGVLPGFPSPEDFAAKPPSTGEMIQKLWELCELYAVHIAVLNERTLKVGQ